MLTHLLSLCLSLGPGPGPGPIPPDASPATTDARPHVGGLLVHAQGVEALVLEQALQLRLPGREITTYAPGASTSPAGLNGVLQVRRVDSHLAVSLILSDGRAYFRTVDAQPDQAARTIASTVANLVAAIEEDRVAPDERGVALPGPTTAAESAPADPVVQRPVEGDPTPEITRKVDTTREPRTAPDPAPVPPPSLPPRIELGVAAAPISTFGLGAPPGFRGLGGRGRVSVRLPRGALFGVGARGMTSVAEDLRLNRLRASVGAGYALRAGAFELPIFLAGTIEPWWVRREEVRSPGYGSPTPLFGLALDLSPAYRVEVGPNGAAFRLGAVVSFGLSAELRGGAAVPVVRDDSVDRDVFRVGGPELMAGIELGAWFPVGRR